MRYDLDNVTAAELANIIRNPRDFAWDSGEFALYLCLARLCSEQDNGIAERLLEWAIDSTEYDVDDTAPAAELAGAMIATLEQINCAGVSAPSGLVYNHDLGAEAGRRWFEIDDALDDYRDSTGEPPAPGDGQSISIGWLVWFAYEWNAHRLAGIMRSVFDIDN